ncbi:MAG: PadR family transcriptional regulator [Leptolinea sp.]|jgi:DNA-binding PadR family transcriptional regulator|nr:PadR family transcriptional regulator [Leptolinea sp.]
MSPRKKTSTPFEIILLGFIAEKPLHGYDLFKVLSQPVGISNVWHINQSNLYAMLDSLEAQGYLISHMIQIGSSPMRKEYHITAAGSMVYEKWLREPVLHGRDMRQIFLAKLFFAMRESPDTVVKLITTQRSIAEAWKQDVLLSLQNLTVEDEYDRLVLNSRLKQISAWLEWLEECAHDQIVHRREAAPV